MNTDNEKNVNLILTQNNEEDNSITISFSTIFKQFKKILSLWLVLAIVGGLITASVSIFFNKTMKTDNITSLVSFNYQGADQGLDPNGNEFDVNKIKSPSVIETALSVLDIPLVNVETIRRNIEINGVIPSDALDEMSLYYKIYSSGGSAGLEAVNSMLQIGENPTYYIINFDNNAAGFDIETGKKIIDEILIAYQEYFFTLYGYNEALGSSVAIVDYKEYDYPAAVDIFKKIYDDLDDYVRRLQSNDTEEFRSTKTGYSFDDIRRSINILRTADLDSLSSYITINNITNDKEQLLTYYNYRIEELEREEKVLSAELDSLTNSINSYEKDELLIFGEAADMSDKNYSQASEKYDELIEQKVSVQQQHAAKKQEIEYYNSRIKTFENNTNKNNADIEYVDKAFADLYEKTKELIDITTQTSDEYYENVVFANAFNILVPSSGSVDEVTLGNSVMHVLIVEAVIFIVLLGYAIISAIIIDAKRKKSAKETDK